MNNELFRLAKKVQEVIFSCKTKEMHHPPLVFDNASFSVIIPKAEYHT